MSYKKGARRGGCVVCGKWTDIRMHHPDHAGLVRLCRDHAYPEGLSEADQRQAILTGRRYVEVTYTEYVPVL